MLQWVGMQQCACGFLQMTSNKNGARDPERLSRPHGHPSDLSAGRDPVDTSLSPLSNSPANYRCGWGSDFESLILDTRRPFSTIVTD